MIHIENLPHILRYGLTHKSSDNANPDFKSIGDESLIDTRSHKEVPISNGDILDLNFSSITLGDFIPFYFGIKMPMLYVIQHGGNFVKEATPAEDIIYLACSLISITNNGNTYYFSDGHATDNLTTFYNYRKIDDLVNIIDWDAIKAPFWSGAENLDLKRKKQAEFLVQGDIPNGTIVGYGCYNQNAEEKLLDFGINENQIKIIANAYY
jgi:hypothetical protein